MPMETLRARDYGVVCICLLLGTILTTALSFLPIAPVWHTVIGLSIAAYQMTLVVLFSMHLIHANKLIWAVVLVASFWFGILLVLTYADYFTREMTPFAPGH
jgi:caa(3)-type oxidase subunit IV